MIEDTRDWSELTKEEQIESDWNLWQSIERGSGGPECVVKYVDLDPADLNTTVRTLEAVRDALAADAAEHDLRDEWACIEARYLFNLLKERQRMEAEAI